MSARDLPVYITQAAPAQTALWLRRVLAPVEACRFEQPVPLELRAVGAWAGVCHSRTFAPDRRVAISSKVVFWTAENIVSVYLHECCHRLLESQVGMQHNPAFFCLNAALLMRSKAAFEADPLFNLNFFYDIQDGAPGLENEPNWRGVIVGWALPLAAELAASDANAELLAQMVFQRWQLFLEERENARVQTAQQVLAARKKAAAVEGKIEDLKSSIFLWRALSSVGFLFFLSVCIFVF